MCVLLTACLLTVAWALFALLRPRASSPRAAGPVTGPDHHDQTASDRLVSLIDMLFALVLTLPLVVAEDTIRAPWDSNVPVVLAFLIGYYVVVRSFVDWHIAMEDAPYWIRTSSQKSWELRRVYVDFGIVMAYAMLFLSAKSLVHTPAADIGRFLIMLAAIIALYMLWGILRRIAYRSEHEYRWHTLGEALVGFTSVWGAYRLEHDEVLWLEGHGTARNTVALLLALAVLLAYRLRNWREIRHVRSLTPSPTEA